MSRAQQSLWRGRVLVWFSCGAASAVAAKKAIEKYSGVEEIHVCYCDTLKYEHPDNTRFLKDVEKWIGVSIEILKHHKYADIFEVFKGERYLVGRSGAPCTRALKRAVREKYQRPEDLHIFGLTTDEQNRISRFESENPNLWLEWNLQEAGITKSDCYKIIKEAGIELPAMYKLGYKNNNCIGCVKGGAGYWNKIRRDFPEDFKRMSEMERELDFAILRLKGKRVFLDELPPNVGRYEAEGDIECGPQCVAPPPIEYEEEFTL